MQPQVKAEPNHRCCYKRDRRQSYMTLRRRCLRYACDRTGTLDGRSFG